MIRKGNTDIGFSNDFEQGQGDKHLLCIQNMWQEKPMTSQHSMKKDMHERN